jgi:predicted TIM-barrel fold metal-dependent hydrolase
MFPPVLEIYDRFDPRFRDSPEWQERRRRANEYLVSAGNTELEVIPYFFVWNDFATEQLRPEHKGIKWHRHPDEPRYLYEHPRCLEMAELIQARRLPVVLEEELENTIFFIRELAPRALVIIPHLGGLNGGYEAIAAAGLWELPRVYADTSLASAPEIRDYLSNYGDDRLLFGSDFPFGHPRRELNKICDLGLPEETREKILYRNLRELLQLD